MMLSLNKFTVTILYVSEILNKNNRQKWATYSGIFINLFIVYNRGWFCSLCLRRNEAQLSQFQVYCVMLIRKTGTN